MKRLEAKTVLIIGSGPIVIGQACEFDYSGSQACKALREEGYRVVLINSNPATIMTDPSMADRTYIEPLDPLTIIDICRREKVDAILPTMGGQTALNLITTLSQIPMALDGIEIIGANLRSIHLAEDRQAFREVCQQLGLETPRSKVIRSVEEVIHFAQETGFPFILRPSFTLGGTGQSFVYASEELETKAREAISESPIGEVLVEESVLGWKEFELELMRDRQDNAIIVCGIENLDPMGVHTGDSITVAPIQTLTDKEYQDMRTDAINIIRAIGVETGGCNVQFAVHPQTGRRVVIEMNPRVSRSSALASKATGFPIAHVATKLAIGYLLSEIKNPVTQTTMACFEPPIDYVALKIPRWHFEKFPGAEDRLGPQMHSVGEVLALGTSLGEAFHKALNSLERTWPTWKDFSAEEHLTWANSKRGFAIWDCIAAGKSLESIAETTGWDLWFLREIRDYQITHGLKEKATLLYSCEAVYPVIDTCSAETEARTPFYFSSREKFLKQESQVSQNKKRVVILGSGPNRIGQGVEFDYCCVHASLSLQKLGFETIMINCNPETVSTDPSVSTRLYLEPLNEDSVHDILKRENPSHVLLQTGGQTPLKLAKKIEDWGWSALGSSSQAIDLCEDREQFAKILTELDIGFPAFATATSLAEAQEHCARMGFPVLVRPSYVLGGRGMRICTNEKDLLSAFEAAKEVNEDYPLFIDRFLVDSVEFDIDGISDGKDAWICGVLEHVEEAGIHSGDSSCVLPPYRVAHERVELMSKLAKKIALRVGVKGFFNVQMTLSQGKIYVLEANPRASRTIPFLAKALGLPLVEWACRAGLGESLKEILGDRFEDRPHLNPARYAVKTPVFPFHKFKNFDPVLGPEMRSTGEVMGLGKSIGSALAKAFLGAGMRIPTKGKVLFSLKDSDKERAAQIAKNLSQLGFDLVATEGTADYFKRAGLRCESISKIGRSASGWDLLSVIQEAQVVMVINTPSGAHALRDGKHIRQAALRQKIPLISTLSGAEMMTLAISEVLETGHLRPIALQDFH